MSRAGPGAPRRRDDLRCLNALLAPNLTFLAVRAPDRGDAHAGRRTVEAGVLVERSPGGERRAVTPLMPSSSRRARLLVLSAALAECAMSLGLGASVCGAGVRERRRRTAESRRP